VGQSSIIGNRDTGAVYARIGGRLYPALNLTSARLAAGSFGGPSWVTAAEISKYPSGPLIGIPGVPDALTVNKTTLSAWSVCDTAPAPGSDASPVVTAIAGQLIEGGRAAPLDPAQAVLATYNNATYVIWGGRRSRIDLTDRTVTFNLGLDPGITYPIAISNALFDALPATEPVAVPVVPDAGAPSTWVPGAQVGSVLEARDAAGNTSAFYVLLTGGVQKISQFVGDLLRTANSFGSTAPQIIAPDRLVHMPEVRMLNVDYYPSGRLRFIDTSANPVTCVNWEKQATDRQAAIRVFNGRGLPVPDSLDPRVIPLVRDDRDPASVEANQALVLPGAANFVVSTSAVATSDSRESLYWLSPQGVRYGIESDQPTLQALGLDPRAALQAPWPLLRTFAAGPAVSRDAALLVHDTIAGGGCDPAAPTNNHCVAVVPGTNQPQG